MKKHLLGLLMAVPSLAYAQASIPFTLKGNIGKLDAPAKIYMMRNGAFRDSATLKKGAFELKGTFDTPAPAMLLLARSGKLKDTHSSPPELTMVFLEQGPILLTSADSLQKAKITGSKLTAEYEKLQALLKLNSAKMQALAAQHRTIPEQQRKTPEVAKRMEEQENALLKERQAQLTAYIKANASSPVAFYAVKEAGGMIPSYPEVAPLYELLAPTVKNSPAGKKYAEMLQVIKAISIGAQAPGFTQQTPEGKKVSLADYRGKYVLVDFWASWCGPCRKENPSVVKAYNEYKSRNFDILSVSLDDEKARDKWLKAIQDDQLTWTQVSDLKGWQNAAAKLYNVQAIPQNYLIDPSGKIVAVNLRGENLKTTLMSFIP